MEEEKSIKVTYTFYLPEHQEDLNMHHNAFKYYSTLMDVYDECRSKWKYDDKASDETIFFAEKIGDLINEAGIWEGP